MVRGLQVPTGTLSAGEVAELLRPVDGSVLHLEIEAALRGLIRSGRVTPGSALPGELELAARLGFSRHTIRHALGTLTAEGLVRRERGRGTRVLDPASAVIERSLASFYAFAWEASARGLEQRSDVAEFINVLASADVAERLELGTDRCVKRIVRVRSAGGEPLIKETAYVPLAIADGLDAEVLEKGSIYDEIERVHGLRVTRAHETIRPIVLSRALARTLHVRPGSAAFLVERTTWAERRPVEWQQSVIRGDRYLYSVELPRAVES